MLDIEEMASLWSYQEGVSEMRQKLLCTTLEFEQYKEEASEELRKQNEYVKQLIQLLKTALKEKDEARDQLQKLLNKIMPSTNPASEIFSTLPQLQADSPLLKATKANSSITESNSFSETYNNYNSHGSSPADSFFDAVSSPEFSNINIPDSSNIALVNQPLLQDCSVKFSSNLVSVDVPKFDRASLIIDNLVEGKPLPQKGKFLQAVLDTPPLLQSLLVAGPLPKWRNPPQLQPFQIPPFSIKGSDPEVPSQKPAANLNNVAATRSLNSQTCVQMSCGSSQMLSTPTFNFAPSGSCFGTENLTSASANFIDYVSLTKRQRLL